MDIQTISDQDNVAMEMNDDGKVVEVSPELKEAVEKFQADTTTETPAETEEGNEEQPVPTEQAVIYEKLLMDRERDQQTIQNLQSQLQQAIAYMTERANQTVNDPNAPAYNEIITDNEKGPQLIDKLVEMKLQKKIESLNLPGLYETISSMASKVEYDSFKSQHPELIDSKTGDVRQSVKDVMVPLLNSDKSLTYDAALVRLKNARAFEYIYNKESTLATPAQDSKPQRDVVARAAALKTETGVSARPIENKPIESFKDAFLKAWDDQKGNR